jgi:hypothetical protein
LDSTTDELIGTVTELLLALMVPMPLLISKGQSPVSAVLPAVKSVTP